MSPPSLKQIADVFIRYANFTLGGGSATTAVIHGEIVGKRRWVSEEQFALSYALGRLTPGRRMEHPRVRSVLQTVVIASAGLLLAAAIPLGLDGLTGPVTWAIAVVCLVLLLTTRIDTLWMILGATLTSLTASSIGLAANL
ncbi:chromate transporter [Bradyrhizobium sp. RDM4]|uniref:chromate transporter n=1 Tax=Bradyrhizobium sp. RDM4 TaxID=3378765 RepID=UPI0038FC618E